MKGAIVGVVNPPAIGYKGGLTGGSLGKAGGTGLLVTLERRAILGGILTPATIPKMLPLAPLVAPKSITAFEAWGVKLQPTHIAKFYELCKARDL